jgi:hypothetical protein
MYKQVLSRDWLHRWVVVAATAGVAAIGLFMIGVSIDGRFPPTGIDNCAHPSCDGPGFRRARVAHQILDVCVVGVRRFFLHRRTIPGLFGRWNRIDVCRSVGKPSL